MKKFILFLFLVSAFMHTLPAQAQSPQKISYQAVARNAAGTVLPNQTVKLRFSVRNASSNGTIVYQETQTATTSNIGLFNVNIGEGTVSSGTFAGIDWANGAKFMQVELDPQGGNMFIDMGTQQMLSVPYALYSNTVSSSVSSSGDTLFIGSQAYVIPGISAANNGITAHTCGATNVHNPAKTYGTMTDQQDNVYKTIVIGSQEWMAENLRTTVYRNGNAIANVTDFNQWIGLTTGAWCYYNNDSQYECPYGKLYNWYAVADPRNVCPTGWHVPTDAEWSVLINYLDPNAAGGDNIPNIAGGKLKSAGLQYWISPNQDATNESGFSGLPGGFRTNYGAYFPIGSYGYWWSSSQYNTSTAWFRTLYYSDGTVTRNPNANKESGFSVRCLRD